MTAEGEEGFGGGERFRVGGEGFRVGPRGRLMRAKSPRVLGAGPVQ